MIAVIAGGTGLVGREVAQELLKDSSIEQVISVGRSSLGIENTKLREVQVSDFSNLETVQDKLKGDLYFCCLGTTIKKARSQENFRKIDYDAILAFAKVAKANMAKSFVLISATGANSKSNFFYNQVKGETEHDVSALDLHSLTVFRPALLMGKRSEFRFAEKAAMGIGSALELILPSKAAKSIMTHAHHLAQRMVSAGKAAKPGLAVIEAREI